MNIRIPKSPLTGLFANQKGEIIELPGCLSMGMDGKGFFILSKENTQPMPFGSELMLLPGRVPLFYNLSENKAEAFPENPYTAYEPIYPVCAFNSPGYVLTAVSAYQEREDAGFLPLFSYGAVGHDGKNFRTAAIQVDKEPRQDLRKMPKDQVENGVRQIRKVMPQNRLRKHLERCALEYGCPAGKNFFLSRYEAPLPTATTCNARCIGCISLQSNPEIPVSQNRIDFTPTPEEIAEVALFHIERVKSSVVSFGQGCEGDPLLAADVIAPAIELIRKKTDKGTINVNTNAGRPDLLKRLIHAGLDSMRVSMNSVRENAYDAYFRPKGYGFEDVLSSIRLALDHGLPVWINYLNMPGFTDTLEETRAFIGFGGDYPVHMIQWRNLNYDPLRYLQQMRRAVPCSKVIGMKKTLTMIKEECPWIQYGYFNPPKEKYLSWLSLHK